MTLPIEAVLSTSRAEKKLSFTYFAYEQFGTHLSKQLRIISNFFGSYPQYVDDRFSWALRLENSGTEFYFGTTESKLNSVGLNKKYGNFNTKSYVHQHDLRRLFSSTLICIKKSTDQIKILNTQF